MKKLFLFFVSLLLVTICSATQIKVVCAENFYGSVASSIGGKHVAVTSILSNPDADPHLFMTSVKTLMDMTNADIVVYNGLDYDPWMIQMISSLKSKPIIINVGNLMGVKDGANPHIWYNPKTFPIVAEKLEFYFSKIQPDNKNYFQNNLSVFNKSFETVVNKIKTVKQLYAGTDVTATEPVFGYMADAMGLKMDGITFQWNMMNDTEPSPQVYASYIDMIKNKKVKVLFYNEQVTDQISRNILAIAEKEGVPVVGVDETMPPKEKNVTDWFLNTVNKTESALEKGCKK